MFSVIIPTIWKSDVIFRLVENISKSDLVGEIILINNNPSEDKFISNHKVREFKFDNIYVNPSWNFGVSVSKYENICLCNDDILFNTDIFKYIEENIKYKIIGVDKLSYSIKSDNDYKLSKVLVRNKGWGCLIFMEKKNYTEIPIDLKIWFGDDWIIKNNISLIYKLSGLSIRSCINEIGGSSTSNDIFKDIIDMDVKNSIKYNLPWSNDY